MLLDDDIGHTRIRKSTQPSAYLHCAIFLASGDIVDDETFRLVSLQGKESISTTFEFNLTLHGNTADRERRQPPLKFSDLIGRRITVGIQRPFSDVDDRPGSYRRFRAAIAGEAAVGLSFFNGIVTTFAMQEPGVYRLTMKPALWKLTLANRYSVYSRQNIRDVIASVCGFHGIQPALNKLGGIAETRVQDWLQAGEPDNEFVERLMGKAHIFYYFTHSATDHTPVFSNRAEYPEVLFGDRARPLRYTQASADELGAEEDDVITQYEYEQTLTHSGVDGAYTRQEEAWEQDTVADYQTFYASDGEAGSTTFRLYKIYQYGGSDWLAKDYTKATADALIHGASQFTGSSRCAQFRVGHKFRAIEKFAGSAPAFPVRPSLNDQWFVLTEVEHEVALDGTYQNRFVATEANGLITPTSIHDTHQGSILAKVVSTGSGVAPSDWRYYTKNNFDPEPDTASDADADPAVTSLTGIYVHFSNDSDPDSKVWVKLAPHMQSAPEIGALVVVTRSGDESELPEIQNIVEAAGQIVVTPSRWTADTHVGSNYSTSYGDGKSVRFGMNSAANLDSAVSIINSAYDTGQYRDASYSQGAHYSYDTAEQGKSGILSTSESYGSTYSKSYAAERKSYDEVDNSYSEQKIGNSTSIQHTDYSLNRSTVGNSDNYSTVSGRSYNESTIGQSENHNTITGDSKNYDTVNGKTYSESVHADSENHSTVLGPSKSYETFGGDRYSESVSQGAIENHNTVNGTNSSYETYNAKRYSSSVTNADSESYSQVTGEEKSTSDIAVATRSNTCGVSSDETNTGVSNSKSVIGVQNGDSLTGASLESRIVGASLALNVTGVSANTSVLGSSTDLTVAGVTSNISVKGMANNVDIVGVSTELSVKPLTLKLNISGPEITLPEIKLIL
ncbi:MAG: hypothetical protein HY308_02965 [Gammaproteobacteria bacterium]|nr:hypothetical protein [Gammaproteobacteria bacterium]